ncbi:MAG: lipoyl(octanoyl) transferase LipB [Flavobacteriales bacterium]|jgi:lipoyl(octanoyl) transferase|uniref:lipoyl(octanoyl) transferase LipB n=1 Tax=Blattabacterium sp. (Mastotermes darwiniensis) TaxID=39768 RepID=UPI000231DF7E|nr:lipoyl(octanoyl) transferase LipB [Blattabacterium sp. (Mastotermes darwiniensis)]AER40406.1 lipoate-protein ligase B [Blattabacterium sp. (Mastotermes darwiniensis) str. MADAR]MDR1804873.1 lipoyl(octanoyl) transferase LipB [Flavobacteriales bacterium]
MRKKILFFEDLGKKEYKETWKYQKILFDDIIQKKVNDRLSQKIAGYLLFVEHPHVYTIGKNGKYKHLLVSSVFLKKIKATFYQTDRGGDITYHGPGQLVVYPILNMDYFFTDIHKYLRLLEEVIIHFLLKNYEIKGKREKGQTGVWLKGKKGKSRKICSIGIRMSRWVTMHGFALNVNTDLRYFDYIIPCGILNKEVTSLKKELNNKISFSEVKHLVKRSFQEIFDVEFIKEKV